MELIEKSTQITVGISGLDINAFEAIVFHNTPVKPGSNALAKMEESFSFLSEMHTSRVIYGINTGLGPMAQYKVDPEDQLAMQYNLIRSHSAGSGAVLDPLFIKAVMLARLNSLIQGYSGITPNVALLLCKLLNHNVFPVIYEHGGVGASGDLVQLSHLALGLIGEGSVIYKGEKRKTKDVFEELGIEPLKIQIREGLSVINGTAAMTGIAMVNLVYAKNLLNWCLLSSAMLLEITGAFDDCFAAPLVNVKLHEGQRSIASILRSILGDSGLIKKRDVFDFDTRRSNNHYADKVQEYYSIRCLPQILGPIMDSIQYAEKVCEAEFNSVSDNPIIDTDAGNIFHGGNFHGDYVSLEMDKLKTAITRLSMLAERQLNFLLNDNLNHKLPPFVNLGRLGVNLGMQGAQFVATSTVAENQTLAFPMYVHSISCNKDNQDIVSMGTNAALLTARVVNNSYEVLAIELVTILQAIDKLGIRDRMSAQTGNCYDELRGLVPVFEEDIILSEPIALVKEHIRKTNIQLPVSED
jgi:histidine ammonia-lyase